MKVKSQPKRRHCARSGCTQVLAENNKGKECWAHQLEKAKAKRGLKGVIGFDEMSSGQDEPGMASRVDGRDTLLHRPHSR